MKIRYLSDLHLEFGDVPDTLPSIGEDLVVLAGDIHTGLQGIQWAMGAVDDRPVIYVMGNHEYYGQDFDGLLSRAREACTGTHITLLENDAFVLGGYRFLGATFWTDFLLDGEPFREPTMAYARRAMNDFHLIRRDSLHRPLHPADTAEWHDQSRAWLSAELASSKERVVVISHHGPFSGASAPRFLGDRLSGAFNSDLTALMGPPVAAWIFGHTHFCVDTLINTTRVVSNQRGYPRESIPGFSWDRCLELPPC